MGIGLLAVLLGGLDDDHDVEGAAGSPAERGAKFAAAVELEGLASEGMWCGEEDGVIVETDGTGGGKPASLRRGTKRGSDDCEDVFPEACKVQRRWRCHGHVLPLGRPRHSRVGHDRPELVTSERSCQKRPGLESPGRTRCIVHRPIHRCGQRSGVAERRGRSRRIRLCRPVRWAVCTPSAVQGRAS